ncbi:MAG TPA: c-type cytochrome [Gammaproteobacteria bacterium]|nr:c-type cytochrome [Gammaproteobacteria bacterium]
MHPFYKLILPLATLLAVNACSNDTDSTTEQPSTSTVTPATSIPGRWYTEEQVAAGKHLFQLHCSTCHGSNAQSIPDWKKPGSNGMYPPPPLNGTAHAWHHSLNLLRKTVREGGVRLGGQMPGFADKLKPQEIDAILAWVQTLWTEQIYQAWLTRSGLIKR